MNIWDLIFSIMYVLNSKKYFPLSAFGFNDLDVRFEIFFREDT